MRAVFLDKDGTLVENVPYNVDPDRIVFTPGATEALRRLAEAGFALVVASNQPGIARGYVTPADVERVRRHIEQRLADAGVHLGGYYVCPHHPDGSLPTYAVQCGCRKPRPGLLARAAFELDIDLTDSWMVGDILDDVEAGRRAGCRSVLVDRGGETEWRDGPFRLPDHTARDLLHASDAILASELVAV